MPSTYFNGPRKWLRAFFFILAKLPTVLFLLGVGFFAFYINDQGQDLIVAFKDENIWGSWYQVFFLLLLVLWANTVWNVSRVLLNTANLTRVIQSPVPGKQVQVDGKDAGSNCMAVCIDMEFARIIYLLYLWVPRGLLFGPYLIFLAAWIRQNPLWNPTPAVVVVLAAGHFLLIRYRLRIMGGGSRKAASEWSDEELISHLSEEKGFLHSLRDERLLRVAIGTALLTLLSFLYAWTAAYGLNPLDNAMPGLIIVSALAVYTLVCFLLHLASKTAKLPVFSLLLILLVFSSTCNNNHAVELLRTNADAALLQARDTLEDREYFEQWLDYKLRTGVYPADTGEHTIYLVAAEGGGIRACYWTAQVLRRLQKADPAFYSRTFAVTGASGGSVGLGFYYSYLYQHRDAFRKANYTVDSFRNVAPDRLCSGDFLSGVTFGFLYPDLWQRFLPFPVPAFDRGKDLSASFSRAFSKVVDDGDTSVLRRNYLHMWSGADRYAYPAILYNSLYVEKGTKAVFAPFKLSPAFYSDVLDVLRVTGRSVPMRECMVSSARFPFITPPGLLKYERKKKENGTVVGEETSFGHLIDGGGFDNKAIQTAQQTALMIRSFLNTKEWGGRFRVQILNIGYGNEPLIPGEDPVAAPRVASAPQEPMGGIYELAPLAGGFNAIFRWIYSAHAMTVRLDPSLDVLSFGLTASEGSKHKLPLGWYLSDHSKVRIREGLDQPGFIRSLDSFQNLSTPKMLLLHSTDSVR